MLASVLGLDEKDEVDRAGWSQERYGSLSPGADALNSRRAVNKGG